MSGVVDLFIAMYGRLPTEVDPQYLELLQMSKYRVVDVPDVKPGKCANCGSSKNDGRRYVDFGLQVDWYGVVFLCGLCLHEVGRATGIFAKYEKEIASLKENMTSLELLRGQGEDIKETVLHVFEEVKAHFDRLHSLDNGNSSNSSSGLDSDKASGKSGSGTSKPDATETESGSPKSPTVPGPKNLPRLEDLLNN